MFKSVNASQIEQPRLLRYHDEAMQWSMMRGAIADAAFQDILRFREEGLLAMVGDELVGIVTFDVNNDGLPFVCIENLAASGKYSGTGKYLFIEVCKVAAEIGKGLELSTLHETMEFYKKFGMIHCPEVEEYYMALPAEAVARVVRSTVYA